MSASIGAPPAPVPDGAGDSPRGLIPPSQRGRSQRQIGDVIVDLGFVLRETVEAAVQTARTQGRTTGQILIESAGLRQDQLARALAERFGVDYVDLSVFEIDMGAVNLIAVDVAKRYQALPVAFLPDGNVLLAMADPTNILTVDEISMITGLKVRPAAAEREDIGALIARLNRLDETVTAVEEPESEPEPDLELAPTGQNTDAPMTAVASTYGW